MSYRVWPPVAAAPMLFRETMAEAAEAVGVDWSAVVARRDRPTRGPWRVFAHRRRDLALICVLALVLLGVVFAGAIGKHTPRVGALPAAEEAPATVHPARRPPGPCRVRRPRAWPPAAASTAAGRARGPRAAAHQRAGLPGCRGCTNPLHTPPPDRAADETPPALAAGTIAASRCSPISHPGWRASFSGAFRAACWRQPSRCSFSYLLPVWRHPLSPCRWRHVGGRSYAGPRGATARAGALRPT